MTDSSLQRRQVRRHPLSGAAPFVVFALSAGALVWSLSRVQADPNTISVGASTGFFLAALFLLSRHVNRRTRTRSQVAMVRQMVTSDPWPSAMTRADGTILHSNVAARDAFGFADGEKLSRALSSELVAAEAIVQRLIEGTTDADHSSLESAHVDSFDLSLSATRLDDDVILWRFKKSAQETLSFEADFPYPLLARSGTHGWQAMNDAASDVMAKAALSKSGNAPEAAGFTAHRLTRHLGRDTVLYVPDEQQELGDQTGRLVVSLDTLIERLPVPIVRISTDGTIEGSNPQARRLLGLQHDQFPPLYEIVEGLGRSMMDWLAEAAACRGLLKPELVKASLHEKEVYLQIALGRFEEAGETHLIGILNDATELKSLEAQFVQSQKMQAIGQLAGGVAHDFNNLLTAISGHCDLLLLRHDQSDSDYSDLKQIAHNANRAASLVGQLLAFSRKQTLVAQPLDLHETMSDLTHLLNRLVGERVKLTLDIAPLDKVIRADRRGFEQVIMNLVVNARDAMPDGGPVRITVDEKWLNTDLERDRATIPAGDYVVVRVQDRGHGITPEQLPKIFEPFYTTKRTGEGTGLGLSTAYGIVKQTGGFIFAESEVGQGTTFTLMFQAYPREAMIETPVSRHVSKRPATTHNGVVLLVEDEAPVRAFASRALRLRGFTVLEAEDAETALSLLDDRSLQIDVFVTDVIMPGLDGPTWVRKALADRPDTRVVFVSGYSEESLSENQARVPNSVFLAKPFSLKELTELVQEQLASS